MARNSTPTADASEREETTAGEETTASITGETRSSGGALPENVALSVPASANHGETAAIAAAVGAHLHDRAAAGAASDETTEKCNRWKLCGRLGGRKPPREALRGEEWKAAGRARW